MYRSMPLCSYLLWMLMKILFFFPCAIWCACRWQEGEQFLQSETVPSSGICPIEEIGWKWYARCRVVTASWWMFLSYFGKVAQSCVRSNDRILNKSDTEFGILSVWDRWDDTKFQSVVPTTRNTLVATQLFLVSEVREGEDLHSLGSWWEWGLELGPVGGMDQYPGVVCSDSVSGIKCLVLIVHSSEESCLRQKRSLVEDGTWHWIRAGKCCLR